MISLLSIAAHALGSVFVYLLKAFFSLFTWFIKTLFRAGKTLFVVLPITTLIFVLLTCFNIFLLCSGGIDLSQADAPVTSDPDQALYLDLPESFSASQEIEQEAGKMLSDSSAHIISMYRDLRKWWVSEVYTHKGTAGYIFLLLLTVLMFIPVVTVLLCICVFMSFGHALFIGVILDAALYVVRAVLGKNFVSQALGRYYRLFPDAGRKHDEKYHDKLLKKRNRELEDELRQSKESRRRAFYEEDEYPDDYPVDDEDFEEEYEIDDYEDDEALYEDEYDDEEEFYEDEDLNDEEGGDYQGKSGSQRNSSDPPVNTGAFNFFAGCNSRESADRKYKSLVKLYHPDNMDGDTAALQEINAQYTQVKKQLK